MSDWKKRCFLSDQATKQAGGHLLGEATAAHESGTMGPWPIKDPIYLAMEAQSANLKLGPCESLGWISGHSFTPFI